MKNAEAAISSRRGEGVKSLRTGGLKKFLDWGELPIWGGYFCWGVSTPLHVMVVSYFELWSYLKLIVI